MGSFVTIEADQTIQAVTLENPGLEEAPIDGTDYVRNSKAWVPAKGGDDGLADAPDDGTSYVRNSERWVHGDGELCFYTLDDLKAFQAINNPTEGLAEGDVCKALDTPQGMVTYRIWDAANWQGEPDGINDHYLNGNLLVAEKQYSTGPVIISFKNDSFGSAVENMVAGRIDGGIYIPSYAVGDVCTTGGTKWRVETLSSPMTIDNFIPLTDLFVSDFAIESNSEISSLVIQEVQDISDNRKKPINFDNIEGVRVTGQIVFDSFLYFKSSTNAIKRLTFISDTRDSLGGTNYGYIVKRNSSVSIESVTIEDIWVDFSNSRSGLIPIENLIQGFLFTATGTGTVDKSITASRAKFTNPRGDCIKAETYDGGRAEGVRMLFCIGDVDDPATSSLRANMLRTINGDEEAPGEYGTYTISGITSQGNRCRGMRTMNDIKRGSSDFSVSECITTDMSDCHHSCDGARNGTFSESNHGYATTEQTQAVKNFIEIQGENINVMGGTLTVDPASPLNMTGGMLVTDYAFPAEGGDGNRRNQSVNVNIYGGTYNNINHHAVRMINTRDCTVQGISASDCLYDAVSFEYISGLVDGDSNPIAPSNNYCNKIKSENCRRTVSTQHSSVVLGSELLDSHGRFDLYNYEAGLFNFDFVAENLNKNENLVDYAGGTLPLYWSTGGNSAIYTVETDIPVGGEYAIGLEDDRTNAVMPSNYSAKIPLEVNDKLYFKTLMKSEDTTKCGILVRAYDINNSILATTYLQFNISTTWQSYLKRYVCEAADTAYVKIIITPGSYDNSASAVGKVLLSNLKIGTKGL